ncbi:MAG: hypothetical protein RL757_858 [Bacteroidota bacterium]|jgi:DNA polymerase-3 subunit delta
MEFKDLEKSLRARDFKSVYFLQGEEPYFIDKIAEIIEKEVLTESEQSFNQTIFYGRDAEASAVADAARRYPMMSERQVVVLREAQDMKALTQLQSYIEKPMPSTVLLICHKYKKIDMRTAFAKAVQKNAVVFESKPIYDNQVPDFVKNYLKNRKLDIEPQAAALIGEYLGTDLSKIVNELDKLALNVPKNGSVTDKHIQDFIGISREFNIFELQKALSQKNIPQANRIVKYFSENPKSQPLVVTVSSLFGYFSKIYQLHFLKQHPEAEQVKVMQLRSSFFLKEYKMAAQHYSLPRTEQIIGLLREYDLKSKGVDADGSQEGELLKELIFKILYNV